MPRDISELNETLNKLRVTWRKANNFFATFAVTYIEAKDLIDSGAFGSEWTSARWLRTGGLNEPFLIKMLVQFKLGLAAEERDRVEAEHQQHQKEKRSTQAAEKAKREKEREARRVAAEAAKAAQQAAEEERAQQRAQEEKRRAKEKRQAAWREQNKRAAPTRKERDAKKKVPAGSLTWLAIEIKASQLQVDKGRDAWIKGTLRLAKAMADARAQFPADRDFGAWLDKNAITLGHQDRAALVNMGQHYPLTESALRSTQRTSYRLIWEREVGPMSGDARFTSAGKPETLGASPQRPENIH